jgi:hypothetical protein
MCRIESPPRLLIETEIDVGGIFRKATRQLLFPNQSILTGGASDPTRTERWQGTGGSGISATIRFHFLGSTVVPENKREEGICHEKMSHTGEIQNR